MIEKQKAMDSAEHELMGNAWSASELPDEKEARRKAWEVLDRMSEERRVVNRRERMAARQRGELVQDNYATLTRNAWVK